MSVETSKPQACTEMSVKWRHHEADHRAARRAAPSNHRWNRHSGVPADLPRAGEGGRVPQARPRHQWAPDHQGHGAGQRFAVEQDRARALCVLQRDGADRRLSGRSDGSRGHGGNLPGQLLRSQPHQRSAPGRDRAPEPDPPRSRRDGDDPRRAQG